MRALRIACNGLNYLFSYLLAGGSLVAAIFLLVMLYDVISVKKASYPFLPPVSASSLTRPVFIQSVPIPMPRTFKGTALSVSPDGNNIAYWGGSKVTGYRGFFVTPVDGPKDYFVWRFVTWHTWSPDSTRLLLQARQDELGPAGFAIASADGSSVEWIILPSDESALNPPPPVTAASWDAGGKAVLFVQPKLSERNNELWRLELENGQKQRLATLPRESEKTNSFVRNLSVSPDRKKMSFVTADRLGGEQSSTWWVTNLDGSSPVALERRNQESGFVHNWQWTPDSRSLIYEMRAAGSSSFQPTTLWKVNGDGTAKRLIVNSDNVEGFSLSPKGDWMIYGKEGQLWMAAADGSGEQQVTFGNDHEGKPMWLLNGDVLYHHKVGSITSLELLVHAEPEDLPGLVTPTPAKSP